MSKIASKSPSPSNRSWAMKTSGGSRPGHVLQKLTERPDCGENPPNYLPNHKGRQNPTFCLSEDLCSGICPLFLYTRILRRWGVAVCNAIAVSTRSTGPARSLHQCRLPTRTQTRLGLLSYSSAGSPKGCRRISAPCVIALSREMDVRQRRSVN